MGSSYGHWSLDESRGAGTGWAPPGTGQCGLRGPCARGKHRRGCCIRVNEVTAAPTQWQLLRVGSGKRWARCPQCPVTVRALAFQPRPATRAPSRWDPQSVLAPRRPARPGPEHEAGKLSSDGAKNAQPKPRASRPVGCPTRYVAATWRLVTGFHANAHRSVGGCPDGSGGKGGHHGDGSGN